jgi:hypothetical protein
LKILRVPIAEGLASPSFRTWTSIPWKSKWIAFRKALRSFS